MEMLAVLNGSLVCQLQNNRRSKGIFFGDNPFKYETPVLFSQLCLSSLITATLKFLLTPLGETAFIAQILGGIIIGPSAIGKHILLIRMIFPVRSFYTSETISFFGCMFFLFLVGVKMDITMIKKSGKKAIMIGLGTFFIPLIFSTAFAKILTLYVSMEHKFSKSLVLVAAFQSQSSFYVISCLLTDLKLLNSELGRLAISSSMISGICSWSLVVILYSTKQSFQGDRDAALWMCLCVGGMLVLIIYILRPIMLWMIDKTTEGKPVDESFIFAIFIMVLACSFFGEYIGQHLMFGPMILGVAVPDGPPLGSALVQKLDSFITGILLPIFFSVSGAKVDLSVVDMKYFGIVQLLSIISFSGKLIGTMLPSLYCKMPALDAFSLGLIMSAQGITDILILENALHLYIIDEQSYTVIVISMVLTTGAITPIVKYLYKPSRRYKSYKRRTILHAKPDAELRILACIYHEDNTPSIINLFEVSNPTVENPICFYVAHLLDLDGRSTPLLVTHRPGDKNSIQSSNSDHIINAFRIYEQQNEGAVTLNLFTSISPYVTMHEDVCTLALEKKTSMVIIPFHRRWTIQGTEESANIIRAVNRSILRKSPCSVGVYVDRGTLRGTNSSTMSSQSTYNIGMFFLGGKDDREALAYAMRMSQHPDVSLTVIRFLESTRRGEYNLERELDFDVTSDFKHSTAGNKRHLYREEVVKDSVEMVSIIHEVENSLDLVIVGRSHASDSLLLVGLTEWNEFPELGLIGDMLASSDSNCHVSVLVVQQEAFDGEDPILQSPKYIMEDSVAVVDMPRDNSKIWPVS